MSLHLRESNVAAVGYQLQTPNAIQGPAAARDIPESAAHFTRPSLTLPPRIALEGHWATLPSVSLLISISTHSIASVSYHSQLLPSFAASTNSMDVRRSEFHGTRCRTPYHRRRLNEPRPLRAREVVAASQRYWSYYSSSAERMIASASLRQ